MKCFKAFFLLALIFSLGLPTLMAQNTSTQGKEFWLSFMGNGYKTNVNYGLPWVYTQVLISGKHNCSGIIENPNTNWSQPFTVRANSVTTLDVPNEQGYMETHELDRAYSKGLRIITDDTVSVFCTNIANVSFDASYVLPIQALADDYLIQCYDQSTYIGLSYDYEQYLTSSFLIVATVDSTIIDITPTINSFNGQHVAGEEYTITLNAGESYQYRSTYGGSFRDLSGTRVTARDCKKIAVFNGNTLTAIPDSQTSRDIVFEQAMPIQSWGKQFVVTGSNGRNNDYVKITSSSNNNTIFQNGEPIITLRANESHIFSLPGEEGSCFLESTYPSAVFLYNTSYDTNDETGDPSMVWIAPIEQRIDEIVFTTFHNASYADIDHHYVNIIVKAEDVATVYLDGEQISPLLFRHVAGNSNYSYAQLEISHDSHRLSCVNGFNAHVYGFGHAKGYAYLVGSKATNLSSTLTINDEILMPNETYQYCAEQELTFEVEVNIPGYELLWDFGDGTTSTQNPVTHIYHERRVFDASLLINTDQGGCTGSASNTSYFYIDATQQYITESDEICAGQLYSGHGFNNILINNDTILARLQDSPLHPECQDSVLVYITAHQNYHIPINDSRCWHGEPSIYDNYGFSFEYDHPGTYDRQLNLMTHEGCDSILNLHLTVSDRITHEFSHHECGDSYVWDGQPYSTPGDYERTYTTPDGCDSIVTMHLSIGHPQHTTFDTITCGVFYWNGQAYDHSGTFQQTFTTYDGCDSIVDCNFILSGNVEGSTLNVSECNSYHWIDTTYTISGHYEKVLTSVLGCDSTIYLNLDLQHTPTPTEIRPMDTLNTSPHWVVTASEFQINAYDFYISDTDPNYHWDTVTWNFAEPMHWVLEPFGNKGSCCKVYVLEHVDDTIWLEAHVFNRCASEEGIIQRYWLVSSFFGIDEYSPSTPSTGSQTHLGTFDVIPNPNDGNMQLVFEQLTGKIDVKVYDMRGTMIDHFQTFNDIEKSIYSYSMKHATNGLYLFVISGKEGTLTKKIIINL